MSTNGDKKTNQNGGYNRREMTAAYGLVMLKTGKDIEPVEPSSAPTASSDPPASTNRPASPRANTNLPAQPVPAAAARLRAPASPQAPVPGQGSLPARPPRQQDQHRESGPAPGSGLPAKPGTPPARPPVAEPVLPPRPSSPKGY
ncbi:hypothetical protein B0T20DRAFT_475982 [Sordaria brevicollis]|uniref:Uncharacterized protein n=1 Tax=Sordaria brevicollis TaxID=83679 RepID=A0AAE0PL43_SORBR|nr:hypothetical protein B0T20DRAFT_475982 [Sordaria brevicollis]